MNGKEIIFITGNQNKVDYLKRYLGVPVSNQKIDLDEIQSLDLKEIVEHKAKQAYEKIGRPVLVEDVSLEFVGLGGLPGPFIKFFLDNNSFENVCSLVDGKDRKAFAKCVFGYCDGEQVHLFEGCLPGEIAEKPAGENGYGFDPIFIPEGYNVTRASLSEEDDRKTYLQMKPFEKFKEFILNNA